MKGQLTILAPGLIGSSIAAACRRRSLFDRIHIWARRPEARLQLEEMEWCDAVFEKKEEAVVDSDLVVLCAPVDAINPMLKDIAGKLSGRAIVTDVGSTKSLICRRSKWAGSEGNLNFIGSHPMAGSEKTGMEHVDAELFQGRACFVTPLEESKEEDVSFLCRFWKEIGMEVTTTSPEKHDEIVAAISHLPHFVASAIVLNLKRKNPAWKAFVGGGFKDSTRIAGGSPDLWKSIFEQNREELIRSLNDLEGVLAEMKSALQNHSWAELKHLLEQAKETRDEL